MIERVTPDLFRIEIPLPESPLKSVNSYVIRDQDRSLVIDTGFSHDMCMEAMLEGIRELGVDLNKTSFFITHSHSDHFGLIGRLATEGNVVYFNQPDLEFLNDSGRWQAVIDYAKKAGFPSNELESMLLNHPGYRYRSQSMPSLTIIHDGDTLAFGGYSFRCVQTPGHTRGHICLYEPDKKILISGDHILKDITPNITCFWEGENPLMRYLESLDKVYGLDVDLVLPGHRRIFKSHKERIDELRKHHQERAEEALAIIRKEPQDCFLVASRLTWDLAYDSWNLFPLAQKWFATGETIAHLRYLEDIGAISRVPDQRLITFEVCG